MTFYETGPIDSTSIPVEAEYRVLTTQAGRELLEMVPGPQPTPAEIARLRKLAPADMVAAALRIAAARAKAIGKFPAADRLWLDAVGLEQATSQAVARHKARRFEGQLAVDLCAGLGGDTIALAERGRVLAVDLSQDRCRRLAWNAIALERSDRILVCRSRAESFPIPAASWVHVDPDRRAGTGRARAVADYVPSVDFLRRLVASTPAGAIKLGPASDFAAAFPERGVEIELISLDGECKEATVWYGAAATCRRRATRLPEGATWTDRDADARATVPVGPIGSHVFDPDPAILRSGLLDGFAAARGLRRIAADVDYLTSDRLVESPFLAAFEVRSVLPFDIKQLRRAIATEGLGPLEIKVRGLKVTPEDLRSRLRPPGPTPATVILSGGAGKALAILARRLARGSIGISRC
ncbi:THUMP-like domain-containing protein [Aquisphaera insulae]|uniref:THUMP-like domain-containing protein n=1 Tax=Aquisphaera insulae TaxID=2712864 RepID=UPI0013EA4C78|nr:class I SAM-dependent methyltransferase [Aquisphaera insulae]